MLDALLAVLAVGVGLFLLGAVLGVVPILTARARRRGYGAFGIKAALFPGIVGSVGLIFVFMEADRITGGGSFILYALIVPVAAWVATTFLIVSILPRKGRSFGPRRTWNLLIPLGWMVCLCAVPMGYFAFVNQSARSDTSIVNVVYLTFMSVFLPAAMGYFMIARGRQIAHPVTAEAVLARDTRPPVVYIRPFARERDMFVIGPKSTYGQFRRHIRLFDTTRNPHALIPFEEYLAGTVDRLLGPFIALGSPEDDITPTGAARKYARDDDWQQEFERMGRSACAFLVQVGDSNNLKWELQHIRSQGWSERLFIVTSHSTNSPTGRGRTWTDLVDGLTSLGYQLPADDPGAGAVMTFDLLGVGVVLTTGADLPIQFVEPIAQRTHEVAARTTSSDSSAPAGDVAGGILSDKSGQAGPDHGSRGGITTGDVS